MSGKELFEGMSHIDPRFIDEAEQETIRQGRGTPWMKLASLVACLCLVLLSVFVMEQMQDREQIDDLVTAGQQPAEHPGYAQSEQADSQSGSGSIPASLTLRIDAETKNGFTGTVVDGAQFPAGTELTVVFDDAEHKAALADTRGPDADHWTLVEVQYRSYDLENAIIYAESITPAD